MATSPSIPAPAAAPTPAAPVAIADERLQRTIRVTNLPPTMKVKTLLRDLTAAFGEIGLYSIEMDTDTRTPYATVEFASLASSKKATSSKTLADLVIANSPAH